MVARKTGLAVVLLFLLHTTSSFAQFTNIRVSDPAYTTPEEVSISINPVDPLNIAAASNLDFYYYSIDGGLTWTTGQLTSPFGVWGDPCVTFDANGDLYYAHLSWPGQTPGDWLDRIVVQKSTDGGVNWNAGSGAGYNPPKDQDKEWITADLTNSPYRNNLYLAWTEFDNLLAPADTDSTWIVFSRSTDNGATWSPSARVSEVGGLCYDDDDTVEGAVPAVGPNGEVYVSWAGHELIYFDKSLDGGVTWGTDVVVTTQPGGWNFNVPGIYRCNGFPVTMCDVSNSPYRGHVYVSFSDQRNGANDTDVFLVESTNGGSTWSSPVKVNDDAGPAQQFFHWSTIDPVTGYLYFVFYDRRNTVGDATEVYMAMSQDGGATFTNFRVSASPFTPQVDVFFGDYINVAALDGNVYPIWTRMDSGDMSVWLALVDVPPTPVVVQAFDARPVDGTVELTWIVHSGGELVGFDLYRSPAVTDEFDKLNRALLSAGTSRYTDSEIEPGATYNYQLLALDRDGNEYASQIARVYTQPSDLRLVQNHPNPFNPTTTIEFTLPRHTGVNVSVYTTSGAFVRTLVDGPLEAGPHSVSWSGEDSRGVPVGSGVYFYTLRAGKQSVTKKMTLLK